MVNWLVDGLRSMPPTPSPIKVSSGPSVHDVPSEILSDSSINVRFWIEQLRGMLLAAVQAVSLSFTISKEPRRARPSAWQPREGSARPLKSGTVGADKSTISVLSASAGIKTGGSSTKKGASSTSFADGAVVSRTNEDCCGCTGGDLARFESCGGFQVGWGLR